MTNKTNFIANFFNYFREVIESAETPFSLVAQVILPVLAPVVPAIITGIRLNSEMNLDYRLATIIVIVLELLGYAGAVTFIKAFSRYIRKEAPFSKVFMHAVVYGFYITIMYFTNVKLGLMAGDSSIENQIFALLSFITVPTGILAAEHINERDQKEEREKRYIEEKEEKEKLRQERRADSMERLRIREESSKKVPNNGGNFPESSNGNGNSLESSKKVPDWRKVRPTLSKEQMESLASLSPDQIRQYAQETGFTYKTISNWRLHAREELNLN